MSKQLLSYIIPILVIGIVIWRLSRQMNARPLRPSRLWIRPAVIGLFLVAIFATTPMRTDVLGLAVLAGAAVAGLGLGFVLASHQALALDPATGKITSKMSPIGVALFGVLFAARYVLRMVMTGGQAPDKIAAHSTQIMLYTDAALLFVFALVTAQAWEIWRRAKPLLDEHAARQDKAAAE